MVNVVRAVIRIGPDRQNQITAIILYWNNTRKKSINGDDFNGLLEYDDIIVSDRGCLASNLQHHT